LIGAAAGVTHERGVFATRFDPEDVRGVVALRDQHTGVEEVVAAVCTAPVD
jgi:hypothetical protein